MSDIIQLLPDVVANQIAAGEVVQRPASAVKELLENAVDAGATSIHLVVKDAGKTLIQVIDNGSGMSETDARLSFERHATSKIRSADDLFNIRTMGFRGEALASIAAVAQVELKTRRTSDELGVSIQIEGGEVKAQEPCACPVGSAFSVKNLFFNVPARRNFLKSDGVELRHISEEFERVAFANAHIAFTFTHNGIEVHHLDRGPADNAQAALRQRIIALYGNPYNQRLAPVQEETDIVRIAGFIGKPEFAKKTRGEQFFFLNHRFIKSPYLHHAIQAAFEQLLPPETFPSYFIFLDVDPKTIDVNIHPTKTEVKFEDERSVYAILRSAVKKSLGQYNLSPSLDFEQEMAIEIPYKPKNGPVEQPGIFVNPDYNPFDEEKKSPGNTTHTGSKNFQHSASNVSNWDVLYDAHMTRSQSLDLLHEKEQEHQLRASDLDSPEEAPVAEPYQLHRKYVLSPIKSGFLVIDQQRAHERILYERYCKAAAQHKASCQQKLFPENIELNAGDAALLLELLEPVNALGFDLRGFGKNTFVVHGVPAGTEDIDVLRLLEAMLDTYKQNEQELADDHSDNLARALARQAAVRPGKNLSPPEMRALIDELFACELPYHTPDGRPTMLTYSMDELDKRFRK